MSAASNRVGDYAMHQLTEDIECDSDDWDVDERKESDAPRRIWKVLLGLSETSGPGEDDGRVKTEHHCVRFDRAKRRERKIRVWRECRGT
jgi:hypothetical protein